MKNVFPAFVATAILVVLASTNAAAKLYRVNNNPGITYNNVVFSNVNDAMTAANAGDTIYLEPSATSCGTSSPITVAGLTNGTSYTFRWWLPML